MAIEEKILIIDDEENLALTIAEGLERSGYRAVAVFTPEDGLQKLLDEPFDLIVTDLVMAPIDGSAILKKAKEIDPFIEVIVVTGHGSIESAVSAMKSGAYTYLTKPIHLNELRAVVAKVFEKQHLARKNIELERQLEDKYNIAGIIGTSIEMQQIFSVIEQIAPTTATVLITGESGTGKELIAKTIHLKSARKSKNFVALNCASLSEGILESELFGHEKGSFTGAIRQRIGRFEYADSGTLFLDEIGDMPISLQVKLLRVIEELEIFRVGSNIPIKVDVRLLAATNRNLETLIRDGKFREDLYYRLKVVTIDMPPLRKRKSDIPLLVESFLKEFSKIHNKKVDNVSKDVLKIFSKYPWPGNVRELKNTIERMVVTSRKDILDKEDIPQHISEDSDDNNGSILKVGISMQEAEKKLIQETLKMSCGNRAKAANILKIGERTLYRKLKEYNLD